MSEEPKGRGRPPVEELKTRKNISVDPDVQELLNEVQVELEDQFGFRPTLSQTIKYIVREFRKKG
jgi:hypothetical protein